MKSGKLIWRLLPALVSLIMGIMNICLYAVRYLPHNQIGITILALSIAVVASAGYWFYTKRKWLLKRQQPEAQFVPIMSPMELAWVVATVVGAVGGTGITSLYPYTHQGETIPVPPTNLTWIADGYLQKAAASKLENFACGRQVNFSNTNEPYLAVGVPSNSAQDLGCTRAFIEWSFTHNQTISSILDYRYIHLGIFIKKADLDEPRQIDIIGLRINKSISDYNATELWNLFDAPVLARITPQDLPNDVGNYVTYDLNGLGKEYFKKQWNFGLFAIGIKLEDENRTAPSHYIFIAREDYKANHQGLTISIDTNR